MTDANAEVADGPQKSGKTGLAFGVMLALVGAGGGYYLTVSGLLPWGQYESEHPKAVASHPQAFEAESEVAFVDLPPVIVLVNTGDSRHLKFHAQLEVLPGHRAEVEKLKPRILDVMNGYLRAIDLSDLEDSLALMRIRGHLLRRIAIVVGEGRVRDVLVVEFVLN
ncbi:MAG: flagellar basal body-associated FliL family protein [Ruegeria sp.]